MSFNERVTALMSQLSIGRGQAIGMVRDEERKAAEAKRTHRQWLADADKRAEAEVKRREENSRAAEEVRLWNINKNKEEEQRRATKIAAQSAAAAIKAQLKKARIAAKEAKRVRKELDKMVSKFNKWVTSPTWFLGGTTTEHFADILPAIIKELEAILDKQEEIRFKDFFSHCFDKFANTPYYQYWTMIGEERKGDSEFYRHGTVNLNVELNELFKDKIRKDGGARYFTK